MTKSVLIGVATAATVSILVVGTGVVQALQVSRPAAPAPAPQVTSFQWSGGLLGPREAGAQPAAAPCPARKAWALTPDGPRLQWVRICTR